MTTHGQLVKADSSIALPRVAVAKAAFAPQVHVHVTLSSLACGVGGASDIDTSSVVREESIVDDEATWLMFSLGTALAVNKPVPGLDADGSAGLRGLEIPLRGGARLITD